jgi:hypothetical protein
VSQEPTPAPAPQEQPAPEQPVLWYLGQRITPEAAAQTRASLMADQKFSAAALAGDKEKLSQLAALWQLERSIQPPAPTTEADVERVTLDRAEQQRAADTSALQHTAAFTPEQINEIVNLRPIPAAEKEYHQRELELLKKDAGAVKLYLAGDREMSTRFKLHAIGARGLPVARDLAEIEDWQRRFRRPSSS